MVVVPGEVQIRLSGGATNTNPFGSLGGAKSSQQMKDDMLDSLFDPISITQRISGHTDYYCVYVNNNSSSSQYSNVQIWFTVVPSYITMGLGTSPINGTEQTIATDQTPPAGVSFSRPLSYDTSINIGNLPAQQHKAVWFRRIIPAGTMPRGSVLTRFKVEGDNA
jgi:hypothetical protein